MLEANAEIAVLDFTNMELVTKAMDVLTPYLHETDRQPACRSCTKEGHRGDFPSHSQPWSLCSLGSGMLVQRL